MTAPSVRFSEPSVPPFRTGRIWWNFGTDHCARWAVSYRRAANRNAPLGARGSGRGLPCPSAARHRRVLFRGDRRGAAAPLASRNVKRCVCWLPDHNSRKPALGGAAETASQSTVRSSVYRAVAGKLRGLSIAGLKDGEGDGRPRHLLGDGSALCRPPFFALPLPLGDPRSSILGDPRARRLPEMPPDRPFLETPDTSWDES